MKLLVLGDIHGRTCWKDIYERESPDKVLFLGDYVSTHDRISAEKQIENLNDILTLKESNPEGVILLRGNHDTQHLGYSWAECSGFDRDVWEYLSSHKERFLRDSQWIYIYNNYLFSHAGVTKTWLDYTNVKLDELNTLPPSELFGFIPDSPFDYYGDSITQPCTWVRPGSLTKDYIKGYNQVVGHTRMYNDKVKTQVVGKGEDIVNIIYCDALPNEYLVIDNNTFKIKKYGN